MPTKMRSGSRPAQRTTRNPPEPRSSESTTTVQTDERAQQSYARISERAYALYEQHGRRDGHALDDWLEAERQVVNENL
jgi:transposase